MVSASPRIGPALLLTLLPPAALAGTWAWLVHGGAIEQAIRTERAAIASCEETATNLLDEQLRSAAHSASYRLELGPQGRIVAPFVGPPETAAAPLEIGIAEAAANARLIAGDRNAALPFFAHAHASETLSAEGTLAYAALLGERDPEAGERLLADAASETGFAGAFCGPVPFALLAAMHRARWLDTATDTTAREREALKSTMLALATGVAAISAESVSAAMVAAMPELVNEPRLAELRAAAAAVIALGSEPVGATPLPTPGGGALVRRDERSLVALPATAVARVLAAAAQRTDELHPTHHCEFAGLDPDGLHVIARTTPTSTVLTYVARACLALAIVTLVLGNLLLFGRTRRELALVRMRRDFVDVVSHELRTPLTALSLKAEMLAHGDVSADRAPHYLQALHRDVQRLTDQVERILEFGRIERGTDLRRTPVPTRDLLARGLRQGLPALRCVGQRLEIDAPRGLPRLDCDVDVLGRALRNLLENAAKYAPPGSRVGVRAYADADRITLEVADSGPGVAREERRAIFQPFVRSDTTAAGIEGSGLGLALVAAAARAHGGSVDVRERPGGGAVFQLTLPVKKERAS